MARTAWRGRVIKGGIVPILSKILPYLGSKAVDAYQEMAADFRTGKDLKQIGKRQLKRTGASVARDIAERLSKQEGSGIRKRRRSVSIVTFRRKKRKVAKSIDTPKKRKRSRKTIKTSKSRSRTDIRKLFS